MALNPCALYSAAEDCSRRGMVRLSFSNIPTRAFSVYRQNEGGTILTWTGDCADQPRWQDREDLAWQRLDASGSYRSHPGRNQMKSVVVRHGAKKSQ